MNWKEKKKRAKRRKIGSLLIAAGAVFLLGAAGLFCFNWWDNKNAGKNSEAVLTEILDQIPGVDEINVFEKYADEEGILYNDGDESKIGTEMTETEIDGYKYIGYISIPAIDRKLPVHSQWDYTRLRIAPCRYSGTTFEKNFIICGHNYERHFGLIKNLAAGNKVYFIDMDSVIWEYEVLDIMTYKPTDVEKMMNGGYDLTLFTCTYSTTARVTVGCELLRCYPF